MMTPEGKKQLEQDEERRKFVYLDSKGIPTIGIGRNLRDRGLAEDEINFMFNNDVLDCEEFLFRTFPDWSKFSARRQDALVNMTFNLGSAGFQKFQKMIAAIVKGSWEEAAAECEDSRAAVDAPKRYGRIIIALREG